MKIFRKSLHQVNRSIGAHKRATIPRRPFQLSSKQNTRKLLRVCAGLRSDISEVKNQLDQKSQSHTSHLVPVSSSLHLSINSVGIAVVWLARQFTDFSVEVLRHLKSLTDFNIEIYLLLLRILNGISRPPTSLIADNIVFIDVLRRQHCLPYAYFRYWDVFESMLRSEFKNMPGYDKVLRGDYHIMRMDRSNQIIDKSQWKKSVFPGAKIDMSIILSRIKSRGNICPRHNCNGAGRSDSGLSISEW